MNLNFQIGAHTVTKWMKPNTDIYKKETLA